jgi:hypothetical protein
MAEQSRSIRQVSVVYAGDMGQHCTFSLGLLLHNKILYNDSMALGTRSPGEGLHRISWKSIEG